MQRRRLKAKLVLILRFSINNIETNAINAANPDISKEIALEA